MKRKLRTLILTAALGSSVLAADAGAIVPPKNCGTIKVGTQRHQIKADQITCTTAKKYAYGYLRSSRRPRGWTCRKYPRDSKFSFRCSRGTKQVYGIKR